MQNGFKNEGYWLLNETWKNHTFSFSDEKYILIKFKKN